MDQIVWNETKTACQLRFDDPQITKIAFDYAIFFYLESGMIAIESGLILQIPDQESIVFNTATMTNEESVELLRFLHKSLKKAEVEEGAILKMTFEDGVSVIVFPGPEFEAWSIQMDKCGDLVALPGGELAYFPL